MTIAIGIACFAVKRKREKEILPQSAQSFFLSMILLNNKVRKLCFEKALRTLFL
jgi:hypothetical protein